MIDVDSRESSRHRVRLNGLMTVEPFETYGVLVTDIGTGGCHVLAPTDVPVGSFLTIEMPGLGSVRGWVAWRRTDELGIVFDDNLPQRIIDHTVAIS